MCAFLDKKCLTKNMKNMYNDFCNDDFANKYGLSNLKYTKSN